MSEETDTTRSSAATNPLLQDWSNQPYHMPPFTAIRPEHFPEALQAGMKAHLEDLQAIVDNTEEPTFENVIAAYDRTGRLLDRVSGVFSNLCSSLNTKELQSVERDMAPLLARHTSQTYNLPGLFAKINTVRKQQAAALPADSEELRLLERVHLDFTRAGAALSTEQQDELAKLQEQLATLMTTFSQNVLADEETYELVLKLSDLTGCPDFLIQATKSAAAQRNHAGEDDHVMTLGRSLVEPFLTFSDRRDLRQKVWESWVRRGELDAARDNRAVAVEILQLRQKVAKIHGYTNYAAYQCEDRMAKTPERVQELLENVWARAKKAADRERVMMQDFIKNHGSPEDKAVLENGGIQPWDWRYYADKVRKANYDLDEALLMPYFSLDRIREAMFAVSGNLYGLEYKLRKDIETYHPDVEAYEVYENLKDGSKRLVCVFLHDNFSRPFKSSGAWMSEYRTQTRNLGSNEDPLEGMPLVSNNNNFSPSKEATLLSYDDGRTLFHEFGHGHHGMLSDAKYRRLASTNVVSDFVELPSQLMEHWFGERDILKQYARHYVTDEPIPDEFLDKLEAARNFQQGFATIEYTSCALLDMALHQLDNYDDFDLNAFEEKELARLGMPSGIVMRHRPAHFQHLFSSSSYAAGYYVYLWAEVLDADAFAAFKETGNVFDAETAARARKFIYGAGNTVAPDELFRRFRGRDPDITYMLRKKGLLENESAE